MADSILYNNVDKILGTLASLAVQEICLAWGVESDIRRLKTTLSSIKAVMLDAEEQQATNHRITLWLKRLENVLYDAEDVLDDFAYEALRKKVINTNGGFNRKVLRFFSSSNPIAYRLRIGHKIKDLRLSLDEIAADKAQFKLAERPDAGRVQVRERETTDSFIISSNMIGREGDREAIVEFLMDSHKGRTGDGNVSVIPIVGIGGLGKTALAKMVFNDSRVVGHFHSKFWVCLGDMKEFNVNQVMAKIAKEMGVSDSSPQKAIQEGLQGKMFLLVLDDVWKVNRHGWLELKSLLENGGQKLAFSSEAEVDEKLMKIGEDIVKKCGGVPLAVISLGSMLYSEHDENKWLSVRDSRMWQIEEGQKSILPVLKFSYDHLPSHLKQCFVYCSIFPEDHEFSSKETISYWMAHGLLQSPKQNQEPEDVGRQNIKELLSRGFFEHFQETDIAIDGCFKMHDLVRDLACSLGQEEFAIESDNNKEIVESVRHARFDRQDFLTNSGDRIRTVFTRSSNILADSCISKLKYLRFLNLGRSSFEELPNNIGTLKHLRCLDLFNCTSLKALPDSICKLHNLQTLNTRDCIHLKKLPGGIGELINLRDFVLTTTLETYFPRNNGIGGLRSLQCLTVDYSHNLRILFEKRENLPPCLRMLIVSDCSSLESLFSSPGSASLTALEVLCIFDSPKLNLNYKCWESNNEPWLHLPRLTKLVLKWLRQLEDLPEWIQGCAATLELLEIYACKSLKALPEWLPKLTSLQELIICQCPLLGSLPQGMERLTALKGLVIVGCDLLTARCEKEIGQDWPKIAHIPKIWIQ